MTTAPQDRVDLDIPLPRLIRNTAQAMRRLSLTADAMDEALGAWLEEDGSAQPPASLLQDVDRVRQSIDCFSILLTNLSGQQLSKQAIPGAEVTEGIYLRDIRTACLAEDDDAVPPCSEASDKPAQTA